MRENGNDDRERQIGSADFIRLDLDDPTFVPVTNNDELIAHVAWAGSGRHVTDLGWRRPGCYPATTREFRP